MSFRILNAETGALVMGGLSSADIDYMRENCPMLDQYVIEEEGLQ